MELIIIVVLGIVMGNLLSIVRDKYRFNKGVCRKCKVPYNFIGTDIWSCRVYRCPKCGKQIYIDNESVDKFKLFGGKK